MTSYEPMEWRSDGEKWDGKRLKRLGKTNNLNVFSD